ncbi:MAG: hypothetical protein LN417_04845 [Candidatus Thermoplasmatota archaeon]|nr:hypothetical protein [Candidatus Thermoplasmatota archaeon]
MPADQLLPVPSAGPADQEAPGLTEDHLFALDAIVENQLTSTWEEIAEKIGVTYRTLWRWRQRPDFQAELKKRSRRMAGEHLPVAYQALIVNVKKGDNASLKLFFQLTGEISDAKLRELFGSWIAYLQVAGRDHIRQLMGLVVEARKAQAGAIDAQITVVDDVPAAADTGATAEVPFDEI